MPYPVSLVTVSLLENGVQVGVAHLEESGRRLALAMCLLEVLVLGLRNNKAEKLSLPDSHLEHGNWQTEG